MAHSDDTSDSLYECSPPRDLLLCDPESPCHAVLLHGVHTFLEFLEVSLKTNERSKKLGVVVGLLRGGDACWKGQERREVEEGRFDLAKDGEARCRYKNTSES